MDVEIKPLSDTPISLIIDAFINAFSDYAVDFSRSEIESMLRRRGFCPELSFAAFADGMIVSFLLNGVGMYDGVYACYDCGSGTIADYRGHGLAGKLFAESLPALRKAGVKEFNLEVLTSNSPAIAIYKKAGFGIHADYDCYNQSRDKLTMAKSLKLDIKIESGDAALLPEMADFCDFMPSWQNGPESIARAGTELIIHVARHGTEPVGYCVWSHSTGDIAQIAVSRRYRRLGVASALLSSIYGISETGKVKILNVDAGCMPMRRFLEASGFVKGLSQFAMRKTI